MKVIDPEFYEKVGSLLYAIAADQHLKPLEVSELKFFISENFRLPKTESDGSKVPEGTHHALITIDNLQGDGKSASEAYHEFEDYYLKHKDVMGDEAKQQILDVALGITRFFASENSSENYHLVELRALLFPQVYKKPSLSK